MAEKPVIGVLLGDAAGVGPELVAKCAAADFYQHLIHLKLDYVYYGHYPDR